MFRKSFTVRCAVKKNDENSFLLFQRKLLDCPHRDLCYAPYASWFSTYVSSVKHHNNNGKESEKENHRRIHQLLCSSVFSKHWTEVILTENNKNKMWFQADHATEQKLFYSPNHEKKTTHNHHHRVEVVSSSYLLEPLTGSPLIELTETVLRKEAARLTQLKNENNDNNTTISVSFQEENNNNNERFTIIIPFSTLFSIRETSFQRNKNKNHNNNNNSLQKRLGAQTLLHTISNIMQIQNDIHLLNNNINNNYYNNHFPLQLCILSPLEEFSLLCRYVDYKKEIVSNNMNHSNSNIPSLQLLCENETVRIGFMTHLLLLLQNNNNNLFSVLGNAEEQRIFRTYFPSINHPNKILFSCQGESTLKSFLNETYNSNNNMNNNSHKSAVKELNAMVRKLTKREESVRQSFSIK